MLFRSVLQLIALALFSLVFFAVALLLAAYTGHLGDGAHELVQRVWGQAVENRPLIERAFALLGGVGTLVISALGVYKTWHFSEISLPVRLEELAARWHDAVIRGRTDTIPELASLTSIVMPAPRRSFVVWLASFIYDFDAVALDRCSKKLAQFQEQLGVLDKSQEHCRAEISTIYLERASILRRTNPNSAGEILSLSKKPLERDPVDWDALELSARHAFALKYINEARTFLVQLAAVTRSADPVRHARAMRFHSESLLGEKAADRNVARNQLENGIAALKAAFVLDTPAKAEELALQYELLAAVHIVARRYRMARAAIAEARHYGGNATRLSELDRRANLKVD